MPKKTKPKKQPVISPYDIEATMNTMRERRIAAGYTQDELGALLNVNRCYISAWESRKKNPNFDNLVRLYRILHGMV